jgi:hypothetical protein
LFDRGAIGLSRIGLSWIGLSRAMGYAAIAASNSLAEFMADPKPSDLLAEVKALEDPVSTAPVSKVTPLRCFLGGLVAGAIAIFFYHSAEVVAGVFAKTPIVSDNFIVIRMSTAIRTLVIGMFALGAGVFGMAGFGLTGLGFQTLFKKAPKPDPT